MSTTDPARAEWTARPLRPVARWTVTTDGSGRRRPVMTWSVPEPSVPEVQAATAV